MPDWKIIYENWDPAAQPLREALCTLGNGYFATRGAFEESVADQKIHYPGTYLAGGYNTLTSTVAGKEIKNEDLVNWPNWLPLTFRHPDENWFDIDKVEVLDFLQELDMQNGLLVRKLHIKDAAGRETRVRCRRFVSMADPHVAALAWDITPFNWSGEIQVRSALDGTVTNNGVARYRALEKNHLDPVEADQFNDNSIYLLVQTKQSKLRMAQAARTIVSKDGKELEVRRQKSVETGYVEQVLHINCSKKETISIDKVVLLYTSRDFAISEPLQEAVMNIERIKNFEQLLASSSQAWGRIWNRSDLMINCNKAAQPILRLHIFHLLQTVSVHTIGRDVGVPARGLHGEAYRGHIFWDELFIFPYVNLRFPDLTRALLMYRYRRLTEARYAALEEGYKGAMFPWQSGSSGREESQVIHLNPKSGRWLPDYTFLQRHINAAVAYNVWQYFQATYDREFLTFYGAELILEIAQFWSSIAFFNSDRNRYEIRNVVGPDEYHTSYPGSESPGLDNNAYTNVMAVLVIQCALQVLEEIGNSRTKELMEKCAISADDIERWQHISRHMYVPFIGDSNIIAQFEGYDKLQEFPWDDYKKKYGEAMRLDRILESENKDVNAYKASKQADVMMLFYLFSAEELTQIFSKLGYNLEHESIPENIAYYEARTSHGSTLSKIVHSWVLARSDRKRSWQNFNVALMSDVEDVQGGTTPEGIHLGAMAGTVDLIQRCYTGLVIRNDVLWFNPVLPDEIECLDFQLRYRSHWLSLNLTQNKLRITLDRSWAREVKIGVLDEVYIFKTGSQKEFNIKRT